MSESPAGGTCPLSGSLLVSTMRRRAQASAHHFASSTRPIRTGRVRKRYVALLIVLLLLGWLGWMIAGAISARPGPQVDYQQKMIELGASVQPEGENGWPAYMEALTLYSNMGTPGLPDWPTEPDRLADILPLTRILDGDFDRNRVQFELALLAHVEQSGVLERLDAAAAAPRAVRSGFDGADQGLMFALLPELGQTRSVAKMCAARMRVSMEDGDIEQFIRSTEHGLALARISSHDPVYIAHLVGIAVSALTLTELGRQVIEHELDEATCRRLLDLLDRHALASMSLAFEAERMVQLDVIQRVFSDDGKGDGILLMSKAAEMANAFGGAAPLGGAHPILNVVGLVLPGRAETTRVLNEFFDAAVGQTRLTGPQRRSNSVDLDQFVENLPRGHFMLKLLLPALASGLSIDLNARAMQDAMRVMLAIEAFEARRGRLPDSLDDLAPEFLASVPVDPVSGQPFVFLKRSATPDDRRTYWLYSVGLDGIDNGGAEPSGRNSMDALRSESKGKGFDYIFNRLRDPWPEQTSRSQPHAEGAVEESPADETAGQGESGSADEP